MKKQFNFKTWMQLILAVLLVASVGCNQQAKDHQHNETTAVKKPAKPKCEVEKRGQQIQNKLIVFVENMKSTISKLHEVLEEHNHKDITEHAKEVENYTLDLMKQSVYLPLKNFNTVHKKTKDVLSLSTQFTWENKYYGFTVNSESFETIETAVEGLEENIKGLDDIPETICETEKNIARKDISVHLYIMNIYIHSTIHF